MGIRELIKKVKNDQSSISRNNQSLISENSLKAYLHIYNLLKKVQMMEFEDPEDFIPKLKEMARQAGLPIDRRNELWRFYRELNLAQTEKLNLSHPFRRVRWLMKYIGGKGIKRRGKPANWAFNFILYAIVNDMKLLKGRRDYMTAGSILKDLKIEEAAKYYGYDDRRKRFRSIDIKEIHVILEALYEACREANEPFLPLDTEIPDLPMTTLVDLADNLNIKHNKYIHAEEPLPEDYLARIQKYPTFRPAKTSLDSFKNRK